MFSASDPILYYHIEWPKTFRSHIYAYYSQCNHSQPAQRKIILYMVSILLGRHCRSHATCSRPRNGHYTTILNDRKHSRVQFIHTVTTALPVNCRNNDHFMHAHYTAWQILQGSRRMFSASELTRYNHIQCPKTFRSPIYAYCNHCNASQPARTITILCILTILLGKHCRGHAECSRPRTQHYTSIFDDRKHSGLLFMHTVVNAITINLLEQ